MMLRDMVPRLDSARMSAMFSEVVATADDGGEFLSPRTELTIEDVRRLRLEPNDSFGQRPPSKPVRQAPPGLPRPGMKTSFAKNPAKGTVTNRKDIFDIQLMNSESGDAESWLVGSPTASGEKDDISEFFRSRGEGTSKTSISLHSFSTESSDTRSSSIGDRSQYFELRAKGKESISPPPSRIPRTEEDDSGVANSPSIAPSLQQRREAYVHQKTLSYSVFEEKVGQMGITDQDMLVTNASISALSLSPSPSPSPSSSVRSAPRDQLSLFGAGAPRVRRTLSVTSSISDIPENTGEPTSPRSEIITCQRPPKTGSSLSLFGRKKSLSFGTKGVSSRFPLLRRKKSSGENK